MSQEDFVTPEERDMLLELLDIKRERIAELEALLLKPGQDSGREVMDAKEAAEFLGFKVYTIREKVKAGEIPGRKVGKEWRFLRGDLLKLLGDAPRGTREER